MQDIHIKQWLNDKTIFITGATGFVGKVIVEKILRECENIKRIYLLIRAKDSNELSERLKKLKQNIIFNRINESTPERMEKLYPICGNLTQIRLGLNENDRNRLISEVDVVFHSGASVKFDDNINDAIIKNVRGTREMLDLSKSMTNLKSFIYISTAYSNCNLKHIEEKIYEPLIEPKLAIELAEKRQANTLIDKVLKIYPNTYVFSKNLAEKVVYDLKDSGVPVAIIRPSIISPACKDPYPGWVDSNNGPMGFLIGAGSGFIRTAHGDRSAVADLVPVDYVANATIAVGVHIGENHIKSCPIYNMTISGDVPITWDFFLEIGKQIIHENPFSQMLWYPGGSMYKSFTLYFISFIILQLIPAIFLDIILYVVKRRTWFVRMQLKTYKKLRLFSFFICKTWTWDNKNTKSLLNQMSIQERSIFNFSADHMDVRKYFRHWHNGVRKYLLHLNETATDSAKIKLKFLFALDLIVKTLLFVYAGYLLLKILNFENLLLIAHYGTCGIFCSIFDYKCASSLKM